MIYLVKYKSVENCKTGPITGAVDYGGCDYGECDYGRWYGLLVRVWVMVWVMVWIRV